MFNANAIYIQGDAEINSLQAAPIHRYWPPTCSTISFDKLHFTSSGRLPGSPFFFCIFIAGNEPAFCPGLRFGGGEQDERNCADDVESNGNVEGVVPG